MSERVSNANWQRAWLVSSLSDERERLRVGWYGIYFNGCRYVLIVTVVEFFCG